MFIQKLIPALALLGAVVAQDQPSACSKPTVTVTNAADVAAITGCKTISGSIVISSDAADTIDISGPEKIEGSIIAHQAKKLITISSSSIESIGKSFDLNGLTVLSTLAFTELTSVNTISWVALPALGELTFPKFISEASSVTIDNTFLSTLDGINLKSVDELDISNNHRLTRISTQVGSVSKEINIASNGQNLAIELPNLLWATTATFRTLASLSIPSLTVVNESFTLDENHFSSFSAPNLTSVGNTHTRVGSLTFAGNNALKNITLPELKTVGGANQIANNTDLDVISFPVLSEVGGAIDFAGNFSTPKLPALKDVVGTFNIESTSVIDCGSFSDIEGVVQADFNCKSATEDPQTVESGSPGSPTGSSPTETSSSAAMGSVGVNEALAGLSVIGGLLQMLL
jgi:hypothetical protein